jgi:WhiB family transcriptional regulator, redox-sensing transcriptional regulator
VKVGIVDVFVDDQDRARDDLIVDPIHAPVMGASRRRLADESSRADVMGTEDLGSDGEPWWAHARCNDGSGGLVEVFFSGELNDIARAKRLCLSCSALVPCLEGALQRREPWGVWGGQLFLDGKIVAIKRRRGRPPKVPRPGDQLPEVPLPEHLHAVPVAPGTAGEPARSSPRRPPSGARAERAWRTLSRSSNDVTVLT